MHSHHNIPLINLDFDDPSVKELLKFIKHLNDNFKEEPNLAITTRVLECLVFIKLNSAWIGYAVEHQDDPRIYKYPSDKKKGALRAHNGMSFHVLNYKNGNHAISDYQSVITSIENNIDLLIVEPLYARTFIRKIQDSDIGCMEHRLRPALDFIVNPNVPKLDDLFQNFFHEQNQLGITDDDIPNFISHLIKFFDSKIKKEVAHNGKIMELNWSDIKTYLKDNFGYNKELSPIYLLDEALITKNSDNTYQLYFATQSIAQHYLNLMKLSLPKNIRFKPDIQENKKGSINYYIQLTIEQFGLILLSIDKDLTNITMAKPTELFSEMRQAIKHNNIRALELLLSDYPQLKNFYTDENKTALFLACSLKKCDETIVSILLKNGADPNISRENGETPLFVSAKNGYGAKVKLLLDSPTIDTEIKRKKDDKTPLQIAKDHKHFYVEDLIKTYQLNQLEKNTAKIEKKPSFENYALTLQAMMDRDLYLNYLKSLVSDDKKAEHHPDFWVKTRKLWSDIVSETNQANLTALKKYNPKERTIQRLKDMKESEPEILYEDCINYIRESSIITMNFHSSFLKNERLSYFYPLNAWEKDSRKRADYTALRDTTEKDLFKFLSNTLKENFISNHHARPRFGRLFLLNANAAIDTISFGESFIIFKDILKMNAVFSPGDTYTHRAQSKNPFAICTIHYLDFLLHQSPELTLRAIVNRVKHGTLKAAKDPYSYNQDSYSDEEGGFFEAKFGMPNLFDPNMIELIHINCSSFKIPDADIKLLQTHGINISNSTTSPYPELQKQFSSALENQELVTLRELLTKYPSLRKIADSKGNMPLHIACEKGNKEIAELLIKAGASVHMKNSEGCTPLHTAVLSQNKDLIELLMNYKPNLKSKNNDGQRADELINKASPSFINYLNEPKQILLLALQQDDMKTIKQFYNQNKDWLLLPLDDQGHTALHLAVISGNVTLLQELIHLKIDINQANQLDGRTALIYATEHNHLELINLLFAQQVNLNHQTKNNETAIAVAAKLNCIEAVDLLLPFYAGKKRLEHLEENKKIIQAALLITNQTGNIKMADQLAFVSLRLHIDYLNQKIKGRRLSVFLGGLKKELAAAEALYQEKISDYDYDGASLIPYEKELQGKKLKVIYTNLKIN